MNPFNFKYWKTWKKGALIGLAIGISTLLSSFLKIFVIGVYIGDQLCKMDLISCNWGMAAFIPYFGFNILGWILIGAILGFLIDKFKYSKFNDNYWKIRALVGFGIIMIILLSSSYFNLIPFAINPSCPVARPYFGSINCEKYQEVGINIFGGQQFLIGPNYGVHDAKGVYVDWVSKIGCQGTDITWLELIKKNLITGYEERIILCSSGEDLLNNLDNVKYKCNQRLLEQPILNDFSYNLNVFCSGIVGNKYAHPTPGNFFISYQYTNEIYYIHFDSAIVPIQNTIGCKSQQLYDAYYQQYNKDMKKDQLSPINLQTVANSINQGIMNLIPFLAGQGTATVPAGSYITDMPLDAKAGDAYVIITDWKLALPGLSTYKYQGQDVYCEQFGGFRNHRLIAFDTIRTGFAGQDYCYSIPTRTILTGVECCNSGECQVFFQDPSYSCDLIGDNPTFTCKKQITCRSDLDCGTQEYCYFQDGKYYTQMNKCVLNTCQKTTIETKCCKSGSGGPQCPLGYWCKPEEGCRIELQKCPQGACCLTGEEYIYQQCIVDKPVCCPTTNKNIGWCKETQQKCTGQKDCESWDIPCHLRGLLSNIFGINIPSVSFDIALTGAIVGAIIFGLLGSFLLPGIGTIIGIFFGLFIGYTFASILEAIKPIIAIILGIYSLFYVFDFLETKVTDRNKRWALAGFLAFLVIIATLIAYWAGVILILIYVALKTFLWVTPYKTPYSKGKWLYQKIRK